MCTLSSSNLTTSESIENLIQSVWRSRPLPIDRDVLVNRNKSNPITERSRRKPKEMPAFTFLFRAISPPFYSSSLRCPIILIGFLVSFFKKQKFQFFFSFICLILWCPLRRSGTPADSADDWVLDTYPIVIDDDDLVDLSGSHLLAKSQFHNTTSSPYSALIPGRMNTAEVYGCSTWWDSVGNNETMEIPFPFLLVYVDAHKRIDRQPGKIRKVADHVRYGRYYTAGGRRQYFDLSRRI